ncbi:hypothetical protein ACFL59_06655 [Planctomycetota bacterium]
MGKRTGYLHRRWLGFLLLAGLTVLLWFAWRARPFVNIETRKHVSFRPFRDRQVNSDGLDRYLMQRVYVLVRGTGTRISAERAGSSGIRTTEPTSSATATVIARDGYLLTAAHFVRANQQGVYFCGKTSGGPVLLRMRTVWAGEPGACDRDVAVVHVPVEFDSVFRWSESDDPICATTGPRAAPPSQSWCCASA